MGITQVHHEKKNEDGIRGRLCDNLLSIQIRSSESFGSNFGRVNSIPVDFFILYAKQVFQHALARPKSTPAVGMKDRRQ